MALRYGEVEFQDERIDYHEIRRRRKNGHLGKFAVVPVLEVCTDTGEKKLFNQSNGILRFVGRIVGLYPVDGLDQLAVEEIIEAIAEINARLLPAWYAAACARSLKTGEPGVLLSAGQLEELEVFLNEDVIPSKLKLLEVALTKGVERGHSGPWFLGTKLSIADLSCATLVHELMGGQGPPSIRPSVLDLCPELRKHAARVYALPALLKSA